MSQQVKGLEKRLGVSLFQRLPRGLKITAEGEALLPTVTSSFDQMATTLDRIEAGQVRELLFLGVVGTFAVGWLLPRLKAFQKQHPFIDVRVSTNNNRAIWLSQRSSHRVRDVVLKSIFARHERLSEEQKTAIEHVAGHERIAAVIGRAGAGKTTMMKAAREAWEAARHRHSGELL